MRFYRSALRHVINDFLVTKRTTNRYNKKIQLKLARKRCRSRNVTLVPKNIFNRAFLKCYEIDEWNKKKLTFFKNIWFQGKPFDGNWKHPLCLWSHAPLWKCFKTCHQWFFGLQKEQQIETTEKFNWNLQKNAVAAVKSFLAPKNIFNWAFFNCQKFVIGLLINEKR